MFCTYYFLQCQAFAPRDLNEAIHFLVTSKHTVCMQQLFGCSLDAARLLWAWRVSGNPEPASQWYASWQPGQRAFSAPGTTAPIPTTPRHLPGPQRLAGQQLNMSGGHPSHSRMTHITEAVANM